MELLQLKYFKTVAERGKLKTAAEELFVSSPALSASIARLESDLGFKLFDRSNNRITLNEQGRIFLNYVNQVFDGLERTKQDMQLSLQAQNVNIQLAVTTSNLWMELFEAYSQVNPEVTLSVSTFHVPRLQSIDLLNDYAFLLADRDDIQRSNLDSILLFVDRPYVMLPKNHRLATQKNVSLADLADETIFLSIPGQSMNRRVRDMFAKAGAPLKNASEYSTEVNLHMVANGRGISFTTRHTPRNHPDIRYIPMQEPVRWEQRLYWHRNRVLTGEELAFKEFVIDFCRGSADLPAYMYSFYMENE